MLGDSLIVITAEQLTISNCIFLEHEQLLITDSIQKSQIKSLKEAVEYSLVLDTLYETKLKECNTEIDTLNKKLKKVKKTNRVLGIGFLTSIIAIIGLVL